MADGKIIVSKANGDGRVDREFAVPYILPFLRSDVAIVQEGASGQFEKLTGFEAYPGFTGSTRLAAVDRVFQDRPATGTYEESAVEAVVITGAGPGGGPHVRVRRQDHSILDEFFAYNDNFTGGLWLAAG